MTRARLATGEEGERLAAERLEADGYRILARRWKGAGREIDLVAERDGVVAFVEVKARRGGWGRPAMAVDRRKREQIAAAARLGAVEWADRARAFRFDVVEVTWEDGEPRVVHMVDAFRL